MRVQLDTSVPVIFGVLCVLTEEQALARAGLLPGMHNHGTEWAQSAIQMAHIRRVPVQMAHGNAGVPPNYSVSWTGSAIATYKTNTRPFA